MLTEGLLTSKTVEYETPQDFFDRLNEEFGFCVDVCASTGVNKCKHYFTPAMDGLKVEWCEYADANELDKVFWMNPPYGREISEWLEKAYNESCRGATVVCLVPARTDTEWWARYCLWSNEIRFIKGRLKFGSNGIWNSAPFPSAVVVFDLCNKGNSSRIRWIQAHKDCQKNQLEMSFDDEEKESVHSGG